MVGFVVDVGVTLLGQWGSVVTEGCSVAVGGFVLRPDNLPGASCGNW